MFDSLKTNLDPPFCSEEAGNPEVPVKSGGHQLLSAKRLVVGVDVGHRLSNNVVVVGICGLK